MTDNDQGMAPNPVPPPTTGSPMRTALLIVLLIALLAGTAAIAGVIGYRTGRAATVEKYRPIVHDARADRDAAVDERNAAVAERHRTRAADAVLPNLAAVAAQYFGDSDEVIGDAESLQITMTAVDVAVNQSEIAGFLDELGFTEAVLDRMMQTRALDGTLSAQGDNCNVTWTYHPDDGLQMVFESRRNG